MGALVWVADDEDLLRSSLAGALREEGFETEEIANGTTLRARLAQMVPDVLLLDIRLGADDGLHLFEEHRQVLAPCKVLVITAHGSVDSAVKALRLGAYDFIKKPFELEEVINTVKNATRTHQLEATMAWHAAQDKKQVDDVATAQSSAMTRVMKELRIVAESPVPVVLLLGESGSGKQVMARLFHQSSKRAAGPFVELNCSALPETLIESELFGHERGAFSDAKERKLGLVEVAEGGTLFLDEIGDLGAGAQAKLLTFLEQRTFRRVGSTTVRHVDVRMVAATNRNLAVMVKDGRFREDLFYRLNAMTVNLPPLRERTQDIPELAHQFLMEFSRSYGRRWKSISPAALALLVAWRWPGNVRELRGVLSRAALLHEEEVLLPAHLPPELGQPAAEGAVTGHTMRPLRDVEDEHIRWVLEQCNGHRTLAAQKLGISRQTLARKLGGAGGEDDDEPVG